MGPSKMDVFKGLLLVFILGFLTELTCGKNDAEWGEAIAKVWEGWRMKFPYVKRCDRFEVLGYCPKKQTTVCVLGHKRLKTKKMCDYCSDKKWYAYKYGTCPDDKLVKIGKELGHTYKRNTAEPQELRRQLEFLRQKKRKEKRHNPRHDIDFPIEESESGSGEEAPEPVELSIERFSPDEIEGQSSAENNEVIDLEFLGRLPDHKNIKQVKAKITEKSSIDKLKEILQEIRDLF